MKSSWKIFISLLFITALGLIVSAQELNIDLPQPKEDEIGPNIKNQESSSFLKLFWEMSNYAEKYEIAKSFTWTEVSHGGEAFILYSQFRSEESGVTDDFVGTVAFRPIILDFKSFSIALGLAYGCDISSGTERDSAEDSNDFIGEDDLGGGFIVQQFYKGDSAQGVDTEALIHIFGLSTLASFPDIGMQIALDVGYTWSKFTVETEKLTGRLELGIDGQPYPIPIIYEDYQYRQKQEGYFLRFEVKKFFQRNYLNYFSFSVFTIRNRATTQRISRAGTAIWDLTSLEPFLGPNAIRISRNRVDLPSVISHPNLPILSMDLPDPQHGEATTRSNKVVTSNSVTADLTVRMYTIPVELPLFRTQGISLDVQGSISHMTGELFEDDLHGVGMSTGGQFSIFDVMYIGGSYTWQWNNDQANSYTLFVGLGLYG